MLQVRHYRPRRTAWAPSVSSPPPITTVACVRVVRTALAEAWCGPRSARATVRFNTCHHHGHIWIIKHAQPEQTREGAAKLCTTHLHAWALKEAHHIISGVYGGCPRCGHRARGDRRENVWTAPAGGRPRRGASRDAVEAGGVRRASPARWPADGHLRPGRLPGGAASGTAEQRPASAARPEAPCGHPGALRPPGRPGRPACALECGCHIRLHGAARPGGPARRPAGGA